ncbi:MAG: hypothetical protein ABR572_08230 [Cryomorphaceae bacterium]
MKTLNIFLFASLIVFSFSCTDEPAPPHDIESSSAEGLSKNQLELINNINENISSVVVEKTGTIDPQNLNNTMDDFGLYFQDMLEYINEDEAISPSANEAEYKQKYTDYLNINAFDYDFMDIVIEDYQFYGELADIIKTMNSENPDLTIAQLKAFEDMIAETTLLTDLEKESLLAFSSLRKFTIATIKEQGIVAMGQELNHEDLIVFSCFEDEFNASVGECVEVFSDWTSPFTMLAAHASMPITMGACIADGVVAGIMNC